MIPGSDRGEEEAGERRAKRSKGGESPRPVQGTEARPLAQLPKEMQPDLLKKIYEHTKSNHITPLCVNTQRTNTYFREQVKTGYLIGGMDHQQTWLKTKCQNNILGGLPKATEKHQESCSPPQKRQWTIQHRTVSNLHIKTTEEHFKHLCLLFPWIFRKFHQATACIRAHAPLPDLYLTALSHTGLYVTKHLYFLYYSPMILTHTVKNLAKGSG